MEGQGGWETANGNDQKSATHDGHEKRARQAQRDEAERVQAEEAARIRGDQRDRDYVLKSATKNQRNPRKSKILTKMCTIWL